MFEAFQSGYARDPWQRSGSAPAPAALDPELRDFFAQFGGASFKGGLYRVVHPADATSWRERILLAFPDFAQRSTCFGFDWLGRAFALDAIRSHEGKPAVLLLDPGFEEVLEVPANLATFHDQTLLEEHDAAVASSFYELWTASGGAAPAFDQCVGYKKPCFLGGVDGVENVELSDLEVYWHLMGQLIEQTRGLPPGTRVRIRGE
jgi:hypothetical protein